MSSEAERGPRTLDHFAAFLAYPCIFAKSPEEAANRVAGLIANEQCGFDQGVAKWRQVLERFAEDEDALSRLVVVSAKMQAPFTRVEWREIAHAMLQLLPQDGS